MVEKERKELILSRCPNYDNISNYVYLETDEISRTLINQYQEYVFDTNIDNSEEMNTLELVNKVFEKYINDYNFAKTLRKHLSYYFNKNNNIRTKKLMQEIVTFTAQYEEESLKHIVNTRWI